MLAPSDAHLWCVCPLAGHSLATGQYHTTEPLLIPPAASDSDAAREGTCAHWAAELLLLGQVDRPRDLVGQRHANGWVVDEEMAHHTAAYVEYVRSFGPVAATERTIELWGLIRGKLDVTSTADSIFTVRVFDLKYGWKPVEARHNWAMLCYGIAAAEGRDLDIELHIYQPRPHHPEGPARVWHIPAAEVPRWAEWLRLAAQECVDASHAVTGDHCRKCPAAVSCYANASTCYSAAGAVQETRMHDHTPEQLAAELRFLEQVEKLVSDRRKAVEAEAMARIERGKIIPGYVIEPRKGNRRFTVDAERVRLMFGPAAVKEVLRTPAELEREGISEDLIAKVTERPTVGRKLSDDPQAYAEKMFGKARG
jgi:hypothetical protein